MPYYKDLSVISISQYCKRLKLTYLLPSQQILLDEIDRRFDIIDQQNIANIEELFQIIKTKTKVEKFAELTGLPLDYVNILRREINSHKPSPRKWKDFPLLSNNVKEILAEKSILTTIDVYPIIFKPDFRKEFQKEFQICEADILQLAKLSDLCRLRYVNHTFATVLLKSGFDCVEKIQQATANDIYKAVLQANENNKYYKGKIGIKDMQFLIDDSLELSIELQL